MQLHCVSITLAFIQFKTEFKNIDTKGYSALISQLNNFFNVINATICLLTQNPKLSVDFI